MKKKIWDFWSKNYSKLWVQKYSLGPTRAKVKSIVSSFVNPQNPGETSLLDIGCGIGELLYDLKDIPGLQRSGLDFSKGMVEESKRKNQEVRHYVLDAQELEKIKEQFDIITCTHSLPYYTSQSSVIMKINSLLKENGRAVFAFASGNNWFDKLILLFVKLTTGPASYPSDKDFQRLIDGFFQIEKREEIKLRPYMPTIAVYSLRKVEK